MRICSAKDVPVPEKEVLLACECDECVAVLDCGCQDASERETGESDTGFAYIDVCLSSHQLCFCTPANNLFMQGLFSFDYAQGDEVIECNVVSTHSSDFLSSENS